MPVVAEPCFHCSQPLPAAEPHAFAAVIDGETRYFCCPACRLVAESIAGLGLGQYYRQRDDKPAQPASFTQLGDTSPYADMDLPTLQAQFVEQRDGQCEARLFVPDIHCASCCWLIEQRLQAVDGVQSVAAQLDTHRVTVRYASGSLQPSAICAALGQVGYRALPWQPSQQQEHTQRQRQQMLRRLGVAGILAMQVHMIAMGDYFGADDTMQHWLNGVALLLSLPVWFYCADPFFSGAWRNLKGLWTALRTRRETGSAPAVAASMDLPVSLAIVAAAIASVIAVLQRTDDLYFDSIAMFVFLLLGARYLEAQARARLALQAQEPMLPASCERQGADGSVERVAISALRAGDLVRVQAGIIPVDGTVSAGTATVEQSAITGEFLPVARAEGDTVLAGTRLTQGELEVRATAWGSASHLARLHQRMEQALAHKPGSDAYGRLARWFTPGVLLVACASALFWCWRDPAIALPAFLAVLVASCPCALSLAIPAALTAATRELRQRGILVTGGHVLHTVPQLRAIAFDKTGTLTEGRMQVLATTTAPGADANRCLAVAAALEHGSTHPVATAFASHGNTMAVHERQTVVHCGVEGFVEGHRYRLGKRDWSLQQPATGTSPPSGNSGALALMLARDGEWLASFTLGDRLRSDAATCVQALQARQWHCAILSGDQSDAVASIAQQLGIDDVQRDCNPVAKVEALGALRNRFGPVAMVGDGINDGPVLAKADVSLALAEATHTAQRAADVVLLNNRLSDIPVLLTVADRTRRIARQNLAWALAYNIGVLPLAAAGLLPPVLAALGMAASSLLVTVNALRLFTR